MKASLSLAVFLIANAAIADNRPPATPARALTDLRIEITDARVARGDYLVNGLLQCFLCHSERDWDEPGAPPVAEKLGAGLVWRDDGDYRLVAANLTPDKETGIGDWTDDMLARAIREGVGHDGRALHPAMWYMSFRELSDEDLAAVIAYLRSREPVSNALPSTWLSDDETKFFANLPMPITDPVQAPVRQDPVAYGKYLVGLGDCAGCHTGWENGRMAGEFAGGNVIVRGDRKAYSTNLTPHPTGMPYESTTFEFVMRTGKGGTLNALMPWIVFKNLSDEDLSAMHSALGTLHPVAHFVGNFGEPSHCAVCEEEHPAGSMNKLELPEGIDVDPAIYEGYTGAFYSEDFGFTAHIEQDGDALTYREDDGPRSAMIPQSETLFLVPGAMAPIEVITNEDGRAIAIVSKELHPLTLERSAE